MIDHKYIMDYLGLSSYSDENGNRVILSYIAHGIYIWSPKWSINHYSVLSLHDRLVYIFKTYTYE